MDGDEAIDGSAAHRRFAGNAAAAAHAATARAGAFSDYQSNPATIRLFDPNRFLAVIAVLFWPLRFFPVVLIPAVLLAGLTMYKHWNDIGADLHRLLGEFSFIVRLVFSLLIINLGVRLTMGAVVRAFGGGVRDFGFVFFLGIIPRFYVDRSAVPQLDRSGQLWAHGAPLLVRLGFFAFGLLAWATYRSSGNWTANLALLASQAGLWSFLFAIMPFMPGDGYNWLATYLRQPMLRQKAFIALNAKLRRKQLPPSFRRGEAPLLIFFAVGVVLALVAFALAIMIVAAVLLTRNLQGLGFVISLALAAAFTIWFVNFKATRPQRKREQIRMLRAAMAAQADAVEAESARAPLTRRLVTWAAAGVALIVVACLPYSYDPAGPFEVLPAAGSTVIAQTDGEVLDVSAREGNWVNAGQVLAQLSSSDQQRDLALTREELAHAEARLAQLEGGSNLDQDAIAAARNDIERLRLRLDNDQAQLERTAIRAPTAGFVTTPNPHFLTGVWLNAGDKFLQIDDTKVVEAEIEIPQDDIDLIKLGAEVRLRPWSGGNREIVGRVTSVAPAGLGNADDNGPGADKRAVNGGTVPPALTTTHQFSPAAGEDNDAAGGEESRLLAPGSGMAPQRLNARSRKTALGKAGSADVIRVKASVPNAATVLRPAMTGYAKISGPDMSLGLALLRLGIRFVTVELWSWVP